MSVRYLARDHVALCTIELPMALPQAEYAARELRSYLSRITGALFEIHTGENPVPGLHIRLNQVNDAKLGDDGFRLETSAAGLDITGGIRGILYGSYEFLEQLGCRFFTSTDEKIPVCEKLRFPALHMTQIPVLEYRFHNTDEIMKRHRFAVKCRINGCRDNDNSIPDKLGGCMQYALFVHTLNQLLPYEKYFQGHPEYYAERDGVRVQPVHPQAVQLCLTNEDVFKIVLANVRRTLQEHPECRIVSISQMDNVSYCTCEKCRAVDLEEGSSAGTMIRFVNRIATALKDEFPRVIFDTLAYQYTRPVPKKTKPADNVCVRLCSIECCFSHPMETPCDPSRDIVHPDGKKSNFITDLRNWGKVCDRIYLWDYVTNFAHYPTPHPNWHTLQPNMQTFVENNVKGVFEQGNNQVGGTPDLMELRQYLISKLLWDPYCDLERHIREFLDFYYGAAAPMIREYMETICKKCEDDHIHIGFADTPTKDFLSEKMLDVYDEILNRAADAVKGDSLRALRVSKVMLSVRFVRLKQKSMLKNNFDLNELSDFFTEWRSLGLTRCHEWSNADTAFRAMLAHRWRGEDLFERWFEEGRFEEQ